MCLFTREWKKKTQRNPTQRSVFCLPPSKFFVFAFFLQFRPLKGGFRHGILDEFCVFRCLFGREFTAYDLRKEGLFLRTIAFLLCDRERRDATVVVHTLLLRNDKILRGFLHPEIGRFLHIFGAISLPYYTENLERKDKNPLEKKKSSGDCAPKLQISRKRAEEYCFESTVSEKRTH